MVLKKIFHINIYNILMNKKIKKELLKYVDNVIVNKKRKIKSKKNVKNITNKIIKSLKNNCKKIEKKK